MSIRGLGFWMTGVVIVLFTGSAWAEEAKAPAAPAARHAKRRVEKHDSDRTQQVKGSRVVMIPGVIVVGRPGRPMAVFESSTKRFDFPVGTARYSPADQRFMRFKTEERW